MTYRYRLLTPDSSMVLVDTEDKTKVEEFLRDSDHDSLPIIVEWGKRQWNERWTGRIDLLTNGETLMQSEDAYLRYMMMPVPQW